MLGAELESEIAAAAGEWRLDPVLLRAVVSQESGDNPRAVSRAGAAGLTGLMPATAAALGVTDVHDPVQSIWGGAKYLNEALNAEGSAEDALRYYHGGPAWRGKYGPESAGYVPAVTARYLAHQQQQQDGGAPVPARAATAAAGNAYGAALEAARAEAAGAPAEPASGAPMDAYSAALEAARKEAGADAPAAPAKAAGGDRGGIARNIAAGVLDAAGNVGDALASPSGTLGKLIATGIVTAHDAAAPLLGYQRFPNDVRAMLLGDAPGPGTSAVQAVGNVLGANPADVAANTEVERLARKATAGAGTVAALGPGGAIAPVMGAGGALAGDVAGRAVPDWLAPAAELAGNVVGAAAVVPPALAARAGGNALARFTAAPADEAALSPAFTANPLARPGAATPTMVGPTEANPNVAPAAPAARSAGAAATPASSAVFSDAETAAYRATAEGRKLLESQQPGIKDRNQYIPGVTVSSAELEQTVNAARELKALGQAQPNVSQLARELTDANNTRRMEHLEQTARAPTDIHNAVEARDAAMETNLARVWRNKGETDPQGFIDQAKEILAGPGGRQGEVASAVKKALDAVYGPDGAPYTDPEQLAGVRKNINNILEKVVGGQRVNKLAESQLLQLRDTLDPIIERGAPGYQEAMQTYAEASWHVNEMTALQDLIPKMAPGGKLTYGAVQNVMRQVVSRRMAPGVNDYKAISEESMARLWALRDDLRRAASAQELARAPGSDTVQNAFDAARSVLAAGAKGGARFAAHGVATGMFGLGTGSLVAESARNALQPFLAARTTRAQIRRGTEMLHGNPAEMRNPLGPP